MGSLSREDGNYMNLSHINNKTMQLYNIHKPRHLNIGGVAFMFFSAYAVHLGWKVLRRQKEKSDTVELPMDGLGTRIVRGWTCTSQAELPKSSDIIFLH
jgi:hypothetical protein